MKGDIYRGQGILMCPHCGSTDTSRIWYGLPKMTKKDLRKLDNNEIHLGGCCIFDDSPSHYCYTCERDFGLFCLDD